MNPRGELEILVSCAAIAPGTRILATKLPRASTGLRVQVVNQQIAEVIGAGKSLTDTSG